MIPPGLQVRRATVDDLDALRALWQPMDLPVAELEPRLTEFQVLEVDGQVQGAIGLKISGRQGRLHSEAFEDFSRADELRDLLWERVQKLALNYGVARWWTTESAPWWRRRGFEPPDDAAMSRFPADWVHDEPRWLTLQIHDEALLEKSLDKQIQRMKETERLRNEKLLRHSRIWKMVATLLALGLAFIVGYAVFRLFQNHAFGPPR